MARGLLRRKRHNAKERGNQVKTAQLPRLLCAKVRGDNSMKKNSILLRFLIAAALGFGGEITTASAQETPAPTPAQAPAPMPMPMPLPVPAMAGPLSGNPKPTSFDAGPIGTVYVTGVASGMF